MSHEMKYEMNKSICKATSTGGIQGLCNGRNNSLRAGVWVGVKVLSALMAIKVPDHPHLEPPHNYTAHCLWAPFKLRPRLIFLSSASLEEFWWLIVPIASVDLDLSLWIGFPPSPWTCIILGTLLDRLCFQKVLDTISGLPSLPCPGTVNVDAAVGCAAIQREDWVGRIFRNRLM